MLLWNQLKKTRLIALLAPKKPEDCLVAYETLEPLGIVLEVAFRTTAAIEGLRLLMEKKPQSLVMAGTILTPDQAERAINEGACAIVSPDYFPSIVDLCVKKDVMVIPGGVSDAGKQLVQKSELYNCAPDELLRLHPQQWIYKLFPAMAGAPAVLEMAGALKSVYKGLNIVYTGGIDVNNLHEIVRRDHDAFVCGSGLTKNIDDPKQMVEDCRQWIMVMEKAKTEDASEPVSIRVEVPLALEVEAPPVQKAPVTQPTPKPEPTGHNDFLVTFGEIMLRLCPAKGYRFSQAAALESTFGGAEANVAVSAANYGQRSRFISALPLHDIGQSAINALRANGVETSFILRQGKRVGIYYLEHGASQRPSKVIYDRAGSSISEILPCQIDWDLAFSDASWFHWSGITPALGQGPADALMEALEAAGRANITVSVDLNYRGKLWSKEDAQKVMTPMMQYVDIIIGNEADAADIFGIRSYGSDVEAGKIDLQGYRDTTQELVERFGLKMAAITLRESQSASDNRWSACLYDRNRFHASRKYQIHLIDRVGGGDAFSSGFVYSLLSGRDPKEALEFAVAASCLKQTITGDFNLVTAKEVDALVNSSGSGRIKR